MTLDGSASAVLERTDPAPLGLLDEFQLDVQVTVDAAPGYTIRACDTSDTCGSTCGSACISD
ncbi:FxLD family lanthipeptide [Frankia sp. CNm7]|uniref:FxLD family lanthipeptide n=1 Tax=Frankia nepalensis TaxID=1836974 RepID=A0A937RHF7_9ACTN|nr:FxLD family lanthipeptide [Frankia nepalensis]MBL7502015.1 FxLD family lanthipeptide [Frankia nepalensis]MBL7510309.1 FxLD family lanthipeptide [Frankia nepalensis]MBL7517021.1 FxLD family lanthipeptide [Frankia nepalensis]MBL7630440.1 FxLD family lanthipeptide [Frankia nepalensis]